MNADCQHFLIVGSVEDTDAALLGKTLRGAPKEVVIQFLRRGGLKRVHLATQWIYSRHHMLNGAVFSGCVHGLKDQQQGPTIVRKERRLQLAEPGETGFESVR